MQHLYTLYQMINMREAKSIMSKSSNMVYKTLVIGIIVLLIGMSIVSSNGYVIKSNHNYLGNQPCKSGLRDNNDTTPPVTNISLKGNISKYGIFTSDVEVTLNATDDQSGVNVTYYRLDIGELKTYTEPFMVTGHEQHILSYWSVDNAGNQEQTNFVDIIIDLIPPEISLVWWAVNKGIRFEPYVSGTGSNIERVEYYIDGSHLRTIYGVDQTWIWTPNITGRHVVSAVAFDKAGHSTCVEEDIDLPFYNTSVIGFILRPTKYSHEISFYALVVFMDKYGLKMFEDLLFPNSYDGYLGDFFIFATFKPS